MNQFDDFPRVGEYYYTRRGEFKVLSVKKGVVTIEWQDDGDKLQIEVEEIRKRLIPSQYAGDSEKDYAGREEKKRFRKPIYKSLEDDDVSGGDEDEE